MFFIMTKYCSTNVTLHFSYCYLNFPRILVLLRIDLMVPVSWWLTGPQLLLSLIFRYSPFKYYPISREGNFKKYLLKWVLCVTDLSLLYGLIPCLQSLPGLSWPAWSQNVEPQTENRNAHSSTNKELMTLDCRNILDHKSLNENVY